MVQLELNSITELHPLPGYLADRVLAQSEYTGFEDLDRQLVLLSKRGFIVSNAMASGDEQDVVSKLDLFKSALEAYLLINELRVYLPLSIGNAGDLSGDEKKLVSEFMELKQRLRRFIELASTKAPSHRLLISKAICKIDRLVVERCAMEREVLYPALRRL